MKDIKSFIFAGGDERQLYGADKLKKEGYETAAAGFEKYRGGVPRKSERAENAYLYDAVVLPLPLTRDGININAPFAEGEISIASLAEFIGKDKWVFGGKMTEELSELFCGNKVCDCYSREDFQLMNALPTAEGIAEIAVRELPVTVKGTKILVLGFGRTGKAIGRLLKAMGACVVVGARRAEVLEKAKEEGFDVLDIGKAFNFPEGVRMTVNTVPERIVTEKHLRQMEGTVYAEAASAPYGADLERARKLGVKVVPASGIPGKTAPETAGGIIAQTIINILKEDSRWRE